MLQMFFDFLFVETVNDEFIPHHGHSQHFYTPFYSFTPRQPDKGVKHKDSPGPINKSDATIIMFIVPHPAQYSHSF